MATRIAATLLAVTMAALVVAAHTPAAATPVRPLPAAANVRYGDHPQNYLDLWRAPAAAPTPFVLYFHGGGWMMGIRSTIPTSLVNDLLAAGISVATVDYRFVAGAKRARIRPPVKAPMDDAARALQFLRAHAAEWRLDPSRVCVMGTSAGGTMALWLAFHDDLADPASPDPVARESTRVTCAAVSDAQTSLDPRQMRMWIPNIGYGSHAFGFGPQRFRQFLAKRDKLQSRIDAYSPYALASADDPAVYLGYGTAPAFGRPQQQPVHSANFGIGLAQKLRVLGTRWELAYPGAPNVVHATPQAFVIDELRRPAAAASG